MYVRALSILVCAFFAVFVQYLRAVCLVFVTSCHVHARVSPPRGHDPAMHCDVGVGFDSFRMRSIRLIFRACFITHTVFTLQHYNLVLVVNTITVAISGVFPLVPARRLHLSQVFKLPLDSSVAQVLLPRTCRILEASCSRVPRPATLPCCAAMSSHEARFPSFFCGLSRAGLLPAHPNDPHRPAPAARCALLALALRSAVAATPLPALALSLAHLHTRSKPSARSTWRSTK